ncbi:MAG: substrate-binding domain-containing protein [Bacteroidetes bacterium]|nr:substrate-binding domain-containing protein [Bacteroidota bacterium]
MAREIGTHIRIKDIAAKAGCSIGTVDRVIHKRGKVSEGVKNRILQIMKELDYKPDPSARALASNRSLKLGILLPSYRKGEFWELPNLGIRESIERYGEQGFDISTLQHKYTDREQFYREGMKMINEKTDGIILSPSSYRESVRLARSYFQNDKPFILIDSDIEGVPSLSFIGKNPVQSGQTVARLTHQVTRHIPGRKTVWTLNISKNLNQMYSLLARESGFMSYFAEKHLQDEYRFRTLEIEDTGSQKEIDSQLAEFLEKALPHAMYVTGSRVHKIAAALKRLKPEKKPLLIGHDMIEANRARVMDESIDFLIEEEGRRQGFMAIETMVRHIIYKEMPESKQMMNLMIYTRENLPA